MDDDKNTAKDLSTEFNNAHRTSYNEMLINIQRESATIKFDSGEDRDKHIEKLHHPAPKLAFYDSPPSSANKESQVTRTLCAAFHPFQWWHVQAKYTTENVTASLTADIFLRGTQETTRNVLPVAAFTSHGTKSRGRNDSSLI